MRRLIFSLTKDDFEVQTFCSGGPGGQNQNKVASGVRIIHRPSGVAATCREQRSQLQNKRTAFRRLTENPTFKHWLMHRAMNRLKPLSTQDINRLVDADMSVVNLKIEFQGDDGEWKPWGEPEK